MNIEFSRDGKSLGSCSEDLVPSLLLSGAILPSDYYWCEGMTEWAEVQTRWPAATEAKTQAAEDAAPVNKNAESVTLSSAVQQTDLGTSDDAKKTQTKTLFPFIERLGNGDLGLWRTFWLHLGLSSLAASVVKVMFARSMSYNPVVISTPVGYETVRLDSVQYANTGRGLALVMCVFLYYQSAAAIGSWRAATDYQGPKVWAVAAKGVTGIAMLLIAAQLLQAAFILLFGPFLGG